MKKTIIYLITFLFLINIVTADEGLIEAYRPNEVFDLSVHLTNKTGEVLNANCSLQIRNESLNVVLNDDMNEIGGGWYNYTYNTSKVGKYFCRQNCTQGGSYIAGTCDFVIKGVDNMELGIILVAIFVIIVYLFLMIFFTLGSFREHGFVKLLLMLLAFWLLLLPVNIARLTNEFNGGSALITSNLNTLYILMVYVNVFVTFYFFLWFIVQLLKKIGIAKREREENG